MANRVSQAAEALEEVLEATDEGDLPRFAGRVESGEFGEEGGEVGAGGFERVVAEGGGHEDAGGFGPEVFLADDGFQLSLAARLDEGAPSGGGVLAADGVGECLDEGFFAAQAGGGGDGFVDGDAELFVLAIAGVVALDEGKDVGTVYIGLSGKDRETVSVLFRFTSWGRASIRRKAATSALILLSAYIEGGDVKAIAESWGYI